MLFVVILIQMINAKMCMYVCRLQSLKSFRLGVGSSNYHSFCFVVFLFIQFHEHIYNCHKFPGMKNYERKFDEKKKTEFRFPSEHNAKNWFVIIATENETSSASRRWILLD